MAVSSYADAVAALPLVATSSKTASASKAAFDPTVAKNEFLQLFATQLQHQDPLDPAKQEDFLSQLAQFSSVETQQNMNSQLTGLGTKLDTLIAATQNGSSASSSSIAALQALSAGAGLLGKNVKYGAASSDVGVVDQIKPDNGSILVRIGDQFVPIANIVSVEENSAAGYL
jgi:flagellar basal-body rod modification protein FlgD